MPKRIRLSRKRGYKKPPGSVVVDRRTRYGNPFKVGDPGVPDRGVAVVYLGTLIAMRAAGHEMAGRHPYPSLAEIRAELAGHDLACWCPLPRPGEPDLCHAALLILLAAG